VLCGWLSAWCVLGAYGHHYQNCQKIVRASESSEKSRRTRLSKNSFDCSSSGGAVREFWWCRSVCLLLVPLLRICDIATWRRRTPARPAITLSLIKMRISNHRDQYYTLLVLQVFQFADQQCSVGSDCTCYQRLPVSCSCLHFSFPVEYLLLQSIQLSPSSANFVLVLGSVALEKSV